MTLWSAHPVFLLGFGFQSDLNQSADGLGGRNPTVTESAMRTIAVIFALALVAIAGAFYSDYELTSSELAPAPAARAP
jgi:amino acid permease